MNDIVIKTTLAELVGAAHAKLQAACQAGQVEGVLRVLEFV